MYSFGSTQSAASREVGAKPHLIGSIRTARQAILGVARENIRIDEGRYCIALPFPSCDRM